MSKIGCVTCGKQFRSMRAVHQCSEQVCPWRAPMDGQAILTGSLPADLGNETQMLLERFVARGMAHDEAACVVASAAADFARMQYGDRYLNGLCAVVASRGGKKLSVI